MYGLWNAVPVFNSVVIASVAVERFESEIRVSKSSLHRVTTIGCVNATWLRTRAAAKRNVGFDDPKNICNEDIAGDISRASTGRTQIDRAASNATIYQIYHKARVISLQNTKYLPSPYLATFSQDTDKELAHLSPSNLRVKDRLYSGSVRTEPEVKTDLFFGVER